MRANMFASSVDVRPGCAGAGDRRQKRTVRSLVFATAVMVALFFLTVTLLASGGCLAGEDGGAGTPSRGRVAALLTALFYFDAQAGNGMEAYAEREGGFFGSVAPSRAFGFRERGKILEFARSLVYEGGYYPREIYQLLGYTDVTAARIARLTRQLDAAQGGRPAPWEVTGRVGRSGMSGASDHWTMAAGDVDDMELSSPGTLAYLPALAVVYAALPNDGKEAAAQLAILKDDDMRAEAAARAAFSLLVRILVSQNHDKDAWLRAAAVDSGDADTEYDIKSVRVRDWRYLRGEECAMGRLERALYLWYKGNTYSGIMTEGRRHLRSRESLAYLSALAAVTYGQESLPGKVIASSSMDRQLLDLINDLFDLATSEAILRVPTEGG